MYSGSAHARSDGHTKEGSSSEAQKDSPACLHVSPCEGTSGVIKSTVPCYFSLLDQLLISHAVWLWLDGRIRNSEDNVALLIHSFLNYGGRPDIKNLLRHEEVVVVLDFIPILVKGKLRMVNSFFIPFASAIKEPAFLVKEVAIDHVSVDDVAEVQTENFTIPLVIIVGDWNHVFEMYNLLGHLLRVLYSTHSQVLDLNSS